MASRFFIFAAVIAAVSAGNLPIAYHTSPLVAAPAAPLVAAHAAPILATKTVVSEEYDPNPQYQYGYDVQDALTGDSKSQFESRDGDVVHGSYSLTDPDGTRRTVDYTADPINGFNAVVRREPIATPAIVAKAAPVVAKVATPVAYAAHAAPLSYAAHPAQLAYAAPVAYAAHAAPVAYAAHPAPVAYATHAAPVAYSAHPAPVAYGVHTYAAPVAKFIH